MSKRFSARDTHVVGDTHDHSEITATDKVIDRETVKRGLDVELLNTEVQVDEQTTAQTEVRVLLKEMILELKKTNLHLAEMTGLDIEGDI